MIRPFLVLFVAALCAFPQQAGDDDILMRAMRDELTRSKSLGIEGVGSPYYIEYSLDDLNSLGIDASLGAIINSNQSRSRIPRVEVRVGDYSFDDTNFLLSGPFGRAGRVPLDNDYGVVRQAFWLGTDTEFKGAVEVMTRKRSALRNITQQEKLNDFAKAEPTKLILPHRPIVYKKTEWEAMARNISGIFNSYPKIIGSQVGIDANYDETYYVNSEGSEYRYPDDMFSVRVSATGQAPDGMPISDGFTLMARTVDDFPSEAEVRRLTTELAGNVTALIGAPMGEDYSGPVLVEGMAAPQLFAQLLGGQLGMTRKPVTAGPSRGRIPASELEGRMGSRILPEWMDAVDDPTQREYKGHQLMGYYPIDMEAVIPKPVPVIEGGTVKNFLLTRQPVRGYEGSNGRARLPGNFGAKAAVYSNLFLHPRETMTSAELKKKLLELIDQRGKPYGIILRKLDFPSTGTTSRLAGSGRGRGGSDPTISSPVLAYKVYPDGREELVRGLRFRGLNVRSMRDILAASDTEQIFDVLNNAATLPNVTSSGGYVVSSTVVAPSVLFEDMELEASEEDWPKLPAVPPPALTSSTAR